MFLFIFDLFLVAAATLSAVALRENFDVAPERWEGIALYTFITLIPAGMVLGLTGTYRSSWRHLSSLDYRSLINCAFAIVVSAQFAGFAINRLENVARTVPLLQLMLIPLFMIGARVLHKSYRASRRAMRTMLVDEPITPVEAVLIVGLNPIAELYVTSVRQFAAKRTLVAGLITDRVAAERGKFVYGLPVLGAIEDIGRAMRELRVHGVYVSRLVVTLDRRDLSGSRAAALETLAHSQSLRVEYLSDLLGLSEAVGQREAFDETARTGAATIRALPLMEVEIATRRPYWAVKRALDVLAACALLLALAPVMLVVAIGTAINLGRPVVFWQFRPGRFGREFRLYKFRSMRSALDGDGKIIADDLRQNAFGRFIRSKRLDELPQLLNVLKGEMSFVGPRPLVTLEQTTMPSARLMVRPGLTGWAQIKGGRAISVADKAALDLWYIRNASLWLDLHILFATLKLVIGGERMDQQAISQAWSEGGDRKDVAPRRKAN